MKLETKVGAFFIGTLVVLGVLILRMEKITLGGSTGQQDVPTAFDQVAGLNPQSAVRVAGVKVGEVSRIELEGSRARVVLRLPKDFILYEDAQASLSSIGILGEKYIELNPGHPQSGLHRSGDPIRSKSGVSLDNLMETLNEVSSNVRGVTQALNQSIGGEQGRQKLDEIVDNIRVLTAEFRSMAQENHSSINNTLANAEALTGDLREKLPKLTAQFEQVGKNLNGMLDENRPELKGLVTDVRKLANSFQSTANNLKDLTDKVNRGEGTIGKLLNDETTVKKLNEAVDNVNNLLGGVNKMEVRLDMGAVEWSKQRDTAMYLGVEVAPRPDYWYAFQVGSTPNGKINDSYQNIQVLDPTTGLPTNTLVATRTITTDRALTFGAQIAKRWGPVVLSGGFIQSRGGAMAEFRFLEDRLRFNAIYYDGDSRPGKVNGRLTTGVSYQFYKGVYVTAGMQDLLNPEFKTFYFGGGIRWSDSAMKSLFGLATAAK